MEVYKSTKKRLQVPTVCKRLSQVEFLGQMKNYFKDLWVKLITENQK